MGNFIFFERHLEECGISIRFDLQKIPRHAYTDNISVYASIYNISGLI